MKKKEVGYILEGMKDNTSMPAKYIAAVLLAAAGDAIGFYNGSFEFNQSGRNIRKMLAKLGGAMSIELKLPDWRVSDDTVMLLASAKTLVRDELDSEDHDSTVENVIEEYVSCMGDMNGRAPGLMCMDAARWYMRNQVKRWKEFPFRRAGGGCGASMRTSVIGARFPGKWQRQRLIATSLDFGRVTHPHPTGYFGAVGAALFSAYAIEGIPMCDWGVTLIEEDLPLAYAYVEKTWPDDIEEAGDGYTYFESMFQQYLGERGLDEKGCKPNFPSPFGVDERDEFYTSISFSGMGGASGHDSVIIAYDALLGCEGSWEEFMERGAFHGGDSDSTAAIGGYWFGLVYGLGSVPSNHYLAIEKREEIVKSGLDVYYHARETLMHNSDRHDLCPLFPQSVEVLSFGPPSKSKGGGGEGEEGESSTVASSSASVHSEGGKETTLSTTKQVIKRKKAKKGGGQYRSSTLSTHTRTCLDEPPSITFKQRSKRADNATIHVLAKLTSAEDTERQRSMQREGEEDGKKEKEKEKRVEKGLDVHKGRKEESAKREGKEREKGEGEGEGKERKEQKSKEGEGETDNVI